MKTAIDKAWEMNLKFDEEDRFKSKEEIIECECVCNSCFNIQLEQPKYCTDGDENEVCTRCWNREIEEDVEEEKLEGNESELTFDKLKESPINEMYFSDMTENNFIKSLKNDEYIINCEDGTLTYDDIPKTIKWLQDVYEFTNKLKNKIEYVDFSKAKEHMLKGNKAEFEDETYYIINNELWCEDINDACALKLRAIESDRWILI